MTESGTDAALIVASMEDPERFGLLFDRHAATLHVYLRRRVNDGDADDVLLEVFRVAFQSRRNYDPARPLALPWLYGIAANVVAKHRHRAARRLAVAEAIPAPRPLEGPFDEQVDGRLDAEHLLRGVDISSPSSRPSNKVGPDA